MTVPSARQHAPLAGEAPPASGSHDRAAAWIYRGVWAVLVSWFRVPSRPPTLPTAGEQVRSIRPARGYLQYLKFFFWLLLIPGDILPLAAWAAILAAQPAVALVLAPVLVFLIVAPDIVAYVAIHLRYDTTWYVLTDRSLRIRRGIWVIHETTVSFENVQNVEVRQNPVERYVGIATLVVQTAGGGAAKADSDGAMTGSGHMAILQGLDDAEEVRDAILEHIRNLRTGGLGDEAVVRPRQASGWSPEHVAVLRDIRDAVSRLAARRADLREGPT